MDEIKTRPYLLGHTKNELQRLEFQGRYWGAISLEVLQRAGIAPGMRLLDLGCGAGDFSLLAADLVGPSGSVLGIDRSAEAVQRATERAASLNAKPVRFEVSDVESINLSLEFDAVIGRFVLMYVADPTTTLRRMIDRLTPGGIVAFIEGDMDVARSVPAAAKVETVLGWARETFRRVGVTMDLGPQLWRVFRDAGLEEHNWIVRQRLHPPPSMEGIKWVAELVRSLLPTMERLGVVSAEELGIHTLEEDLHQALLSHDAALLTPCVVGAYGRVHKS